MDRTEALLRLAEKAMTIANEARTEVAAVRSALPSFVVSFVVDEDGNLVATNSIGVASRIGRVRGADGTDGAVGATIKNAKIAEDGSLLLTLTDGRDINTGRARGAPGAAGRDAEPGKDGRSIVSGKVDGTVLVLTFNDGSQERVGDVVGPQGPAGRDVTSVAIDDAGDLIVTYSDGACLNTGRVRGRDGDRGPSGPMGAYVEAADIDGGALRLTLSDGRVLRVGHVVGRDGKPGKDAVPVNGRDGKDGKDAKPGRDGRDGLDGTLVEINDAGPARLTAADLANVRLAELVIGNETHRILTY